jgi:magnesium transporter
MAGGAEGDGVHGGAPAGAGTTAGGSLAAHLATDVPVTRPDVPAELIRAALAGQRFATTAAVAVCEDGRLVGLIRSDDLLAAPAGTAAAELVDEGAAVVAATADREVAVQLAVRRGRDTVAVVSAARHASVESVVRRYRHRLPWLLLGLAGAMLSADMMGSFEGQLERNVILAFFIPGVVYMADAVGTQTETLVVRGLSIGVGIRQVLWREQLTGLLVGATVAAAFLPLGLWRWGEPDVVLTVALAPLVACSIATIVAMALPWLLHRFGLDPLR